MKWLLALALFTSPALAQADGLVGKTFDEVVKGTAFDPARKASGQTRQAFTDTLNGPQTPGVVVRAGGREFLVFEACTAHLCAFQHSVTAIDTQTGAFYAAVYGDAKTIIVADPSIAQVVDPACNQNRCDFTQVVSYGAKFEPEPLTPDDLKGFPGGAMCDAFDASGKIILHTEGVAVMRFQGQRIMLREDGIGTDHLYSVDHEPPMVVTFSPRPGVLTKAYDEVTMRAKFLTVLKDNRAVSIPVLLRCES